MKEDSDYTRDIAEIRSMMERSSKFMSLSGWAGILAGIYALAGAAVAWKVYGFNPDRIYYENMDAEYFNVLPLAGLVLLLAVGTAVLDSFVKARKRGEKAWNAISRRLLANMAAPLVAGGIIMLVMIHYGLIGLVAPLSLIFYGLSLYTAGNFTFNEVRILGIVQIILGIIALHMISQGLLIWAIGFGAAHILYGIHMFFKH